MLFRVHVLAGLFVWLILDMILEMPFFVLIFVLLGAVFVDIDSGTSKIARRFWIVSWVFSHRGFIHSLLGCLIFSLMIGAVNLWAGFGFFAGYLSHLIMDCFTFAGIRIFWPFKFKIKGFVKSGGWVEDVLFVLLLFVDLFLLVYKFL